MSIIETTDKALEKRQPSAVEALAATAGLDVAEFYQTVVATCFPGKPTREQFTAFCMVAREYCLNPLTKQIYAFPGKGGGVVPIVGIDGWLAILNRQAAYDGMNIEEVLDEGGDVVAVKVSIYRKDRSHPTVVSEYARECAKNTEPWKKWPIRMLRHKSIVQAIRIAFSLSGIYDPDEGERIAEATVLDVPGSADGDELTDALNSEIAGEPQAAQEAETEPQNQEESDAQGTR